MTYLSSEAKASQFKMFPKFTKRETLVDQCSVQKIATLQGFQNTMITIYSRM